MNPINGNGSPNNPDADLESSLANSEFEVENLQEIADSPPKSPEHEIENVYEPDVPEKKLSGDFELPSERSQLGAKSKQKASRSRRSTAVKFKDLTGFSDGSAPSSLEQSTSNRGASTSRGSVPEEPATPQGETAPGAGPLTITQGELAPPLDVDSAQIIQPNSNSDPNSNMSKSEKIATPRDPPKSGNARRGKGPMGRGTTQPQGTIMPRRFTLAGRSERKSVLAILEGSSQSAEERFADDGEAEGGVTMRPIEALPYRMLATYDFASLTTHYGIGRLFTDVVRNLEAPTPPVSFVGVALKEPVSLHGYVPVYRQVALGVDMTKGIFFLLDVDTSAVIKTILNPKAMPTTRSVGIAHLSSIELKLPKNWPHPTKTLPKNVAQLPHFCSIPIVGRDFPIVLVAKDAQQAADVLTLTTFAAAYQARLHKEMLWHQLYQNSIEASCPRKSQPSTAIEAVLKNHLPLSTLANPPPPPTPKPIADRVPGQSQPRAAARAK